MTKFVNLKIPQGLNRKYIYETNCIKDNYKQKVQQYCQKYNKYLRLSVHDKCLDRLNKYLQKTLNSDSQFFFSLKKIKCKLNFLQQNGVVSISEYESDQINITQIRPTLNYQFIRDPNLKKMKKCVDKYLREIEQYQYLIESKESHESDKPFIHLNSWGLKSLRYIMKKYGREDIVTAKRRAQKRKEIMKADDHQNSACYLSDVSDDDKNDNGSEEEEQDEETDEENCDNIDTDEIQQTIEDTKRRKKYEERGLQAAYNRGGIKGMLRQQQIMLGYGVRGFDEEDLFNNGIKRYGGQYYF